MNVDSEFPKEVEVVGANRERVVVGIEYLGFLLSVRSANPLVI